MDIDLSIPSIILNKKDMTYKEIMLDRILDEKTVNEVGEFWASTHAPKFGSDCTEDEDEFRSLVKQGDSIIRNEVFKPFLNEVANYREDFISSDREVAAFAATFIIFANA